MILMFMQNGILLPLLTARDRVILVFTGFYEILCFWPSYWICNSTFQKLDDGRFVISDPKNLYIPISSQKIGVFSKFCPLHWTAILDFPNLIADL